MEPFIGVIIEESLEDKSVLKDVEIISTNVQPVTERKRTPWVTRWTLHTVQIEPSQTDEIALQLSRTLDSKHSWYADFKDTYTHYVIFKNKVFKIDREHEQQYKKVIDYGLSLGIPIYQLDFV